MLYCYQNRPVYSVTERQVSVRVRCSYAKCCNSSAVNFTAVIRMSLNKTERENFNRKLAGID